MTDFTIGKSHGVDVIFVKDWSDACRQMVDSGKVSRVILRQGRGWNPSSLEFLREMPFLTGLEVSTFSKFEPIDVIHELADLEFLKLQIPDSPSFDFGVMPKLKECIVSYKPGYHSIFSAGQIESVYLIELRVDRLPPTSGMTSLRTFTAKSGSVKVLNLAAPFLQKLELIAISKFKDFLSIELPRLESLHCTSCKSLSSLEGLERCTELRELEIVDCGKIKSLKPLGALLHLETLKIGGETVIEDGDFACLEALPRLRKIWIRHHPHYSHKVRFGRLRKRYGFKELWAALRGGASRSA